MAARGRVTGWHHSSCISFRPNSRPEVDRALVANQSQRSGSSPIARGSAACLRDIHTFFVPPGSGAMLGIPALAHPSIFVPPGIGAMLGIPALAHPSVTEQGWTCGKLHFPLTCILARSSWNALSLSLSSLFSFSSPAMIFSNSALSKAMFTARSFAPRARALSCSSLNVGMCYWC